MNFTEEELKAIRKYKKAKNDVWRKNNPEKWNAYAQGWRKLNPDKVKAYRKAYYEAHKDKTKQDAVRWYKANPHLVIASVKANSANRRYPGKVTVKDIRLVLKKGNNTCYWCKKANLSGGDLTLEHLKPVNDPKYLVVACYSCNAKRNVGGKGNQYTKKWEE